MTAHAVDASFDGQRRLDLDWIRIAAFGLLILYHVGMLYVSWSFHVKSTHRSLGLEALMLALNPWRLALLFFISGAASRFMLAKWRPGAFARQRSIRLLLPLVFGMLVIVPPQSYLEVVEKYGYAGTFAEFYWRHYLTLRIFPGSQGLILPTWNHLWFIAYLWVYTLLAALIAVSPWLVRRVDRVVAASLRGIGLLLLPAALLALFRLVLFPSFPVTHTLIDDWYSHAVFGLVFALGFFSAGTTSIWDAMVRWRWTALLLAIAAYGVIVFTRGLPATEPLGLVRKVAYGLDQWCFIVAILGFGRRFLTVADGPVRRYLTDAVFPYYIVHQTAIVALAFWLKRFAVPAAVEVLVVVLGTVAACALTYELVRRIPSLGPLFGLRARPAGDQTDTSCSTRPSVPNISR